MEKEPAKTKVTIIRNPKNGVSYLYSDKHYWDKEKKQTRHKRICIGKLDPVSGTPVYNQRYLSRHGGFPGDAESFSVAHNADRNPVMHRLEDGIRLGFHLRKAFGEKTARAVLALSWYEACTRLPLYLAPIWLERRGMGKALAGFGNPGCLFDEMTSGRINEFMEEWSGEHSDGKVQLYDVVSVASEGRHNRYMDYGNREREALEHADLVIMTNGVGLPLKFFRTEGALRSCSYLDVVSSSLGMDPDLSGCMLNLDKNDYAEEFLSGLDERRIDFQIRIPFHDKWQKVLFERNRNTILGEVPIIGFDGLPIRCHTVETEKGYAHLFFDETWRRQQERNLLVLIATCKNELQDGLYIDEHQQIYDRYFEVRKAGTRRRVSIRKEALERFYGSLAGFWAILTNAESSGRAAFGAYSRHTRMERFFDDIFCEDDCISLRIHEPSRRNAGLFIKFLALIIHDSLEKLSEPDGISTEEAIVFMDGIRSLPSVRGCGGGLSGWYGQERGKAAADPEA